MYASNMFRILQGSTSIVIGEAVTFLDVSLGFLNFPVLECLGGTLSASEG